MVGVGNTLIRSIRMHTVFNTADQVLGSGTIFGAVALNAGGYTVRVMGILGILAGIKGAGMLAGFDTFIPMMAGVLATNTVIGFTRADTG